MRTAVTDPRLKTYRAEVSGWDRFQTFFVEKCDLEWNEEAGKQVTLARSLRPGAMVFVRLLQPISPEQSFPVPYRTELSKLSADGQTKFRLSPAKPIPGLERMSLS